MGAELFKTHHNFDTLFYDDVAGSMAYVRAISPHQPLILYGQSMGGAAIMRAIDVNDIQPDAIIIEAVFDKMLSTVQNRFSAMGLPSFPGAHLLVFWGGVQNLNGPKQFKKFEGVGHESYFEAQPDQWRRFVAKFLTR